jgi:hypothetical protein
MYSQIRLELVGLRQQELRAEAARARLAAEARRTGRGSRTDWMNRVPDWRRSSRTASIHPAVAPSPAVPGAFIDKPQE